MSASPIPIFVVGTARSGTTWLGNALAGHSAIAAVEHPMHWGQKESDIFSCQEFAGDLSNDRRFVEFLEIYAAGDFFRIAGGDKEFFYQKRPKDFIELFFELMDQLAFKSGSPYWITKLDPKFLYRQDALREFVARLDARYTRVRFFGVERDFDSVARSYLGMEGARSIHALPWFGKQLALLLESARYAVHGSTMQDFLRERDEPVVDYNELKSSARQCLSQVCSSLELEFEDALTKRRFPANSSHLHASRTPPLSDVSLALARNLYLPFFSAFPQLGKLLLKSRDKTRGGRSPVTFRLLRFEKMPESLYRELTRNGELALRDLIFETEEPPAEPMGRSAHLGR